METIKQRAIRAAKKFPTGRGLAWPWVKLTAALIDAECMDQVRIAHNAGGELTVAEIMEFRDEFVAALKAAGFTP